MFAIPPVISLLVFIYMRPQEIWPVLQRVPILYVLVLLTLVAVVLDLRLSWTRLGRNPLLPWAAAHLAWNLVSMVVVARWALPTHGVSLVVAFIIFLALSQGIQTFRALGTAGAVLLAMSLFITVVGVHQAYAPLECVRPSEETRDVLVPLGTSCVTTDMCREQYQRQDVLCEHVGLVSTTSIGQRVRYRGIMQDPNELALVTSIAVALAFAFFELKRSLPRLLLAAATLGGVGVCVVNTKSRSGQIAFLMVIGVYLLRRLRWAGVGLALVMGLPILLLGGRSTSEADESSALRLGYWAAAIQMARDSPLVGVGMGQFGELQPETAHNSLMLALGETGIPGLFFWTALIYMAFKTALSILRAQKGPEAQVARVWACALLASFAGFTGSAFFLSLTDHYVLWVYLGLVGALYAATVTHDPKFRVGFGLRDLAAVIGFDFVFVLAVHVYTRSLGM
jgi:hypothetical protein